jgi:hypothetical protein
MIRKNLLVTILATLLVVGGLSFVVRAALSAEGDSRTAEPTATGQKTAEAEIWALEQAYWQFNRDANHEGIISTWHDKFLGWPDGEPRPIDKEEGARYVRENYAKPASYSFQIAPAGIRILGKVAINHYTVHLRPTDGRAEQKERSMRITHTWIQDRAGWKVLGGMSDAQ